MNFSTPILLSGIGTDVGKTLVSAALCQKFTLPYWKPVQCGLEERDSDFLKENGVQIFPEQFSLEAPLSPHHAAKLESVGIESQDFVLPKEGQLLVEGAGGLMVPMNDEGYNYLDFARDHKLPIVLVSRNYLGSINHTLLSLNAIKAYNLDLIGIIISGNRYPEGEQCYLNAGAKIIGALPELTEFTDLGSKLEWYGVD